LKRFVCGLVQLGWIEGGNAQMEQRWIDGDAERALSLAEELVASMEEVA